MEGQWPGEYKIHWPPLFPHIWIPECELSQLDVTIRYEVRIFLETYGLFKSYPTDFDYE